MGRLRRRSIVRPLPGHGAESGVPRAPQADAMADQIAEGEQDGVEPF